MEAQKADLGSVDIHKEVIAEIVETVIKEIPGVSLFEGDALSQFTSFLGGCKLPAVKVKFNHNNEISVTVMVRVKYGLNISDTASKLQLAVKEALEKSVRANIISININIQGILRG